MAPVSGVIYLVMPASLETADLSSARYQKRAIRMAGNKTVSQGMHDLSLMKIKSRETAPSKSFTNMKVIEKFCCTISSIPVKTTLINGLFFIFGLTAL